MAPEPAPAVVVAKAAPPPPSATHAPTSNAPPTTSRASVVTPTQQAQPQANTRRIVRPKPAPRVHREEKKAVKSLAGAIEKRATRISLGVGPAVSDSSNRLLFLGGLALLFLVLGDAAFLALTARVLRDPTER
jgi:hypothetical protein